MKLPISAPLQSYLLFIGIAVLPVYVFDSGGIQPSHAILALFSIIAFFGAKLKLEPYSLTLLSLTVWSFFVDSIFGIPTTDGLLYLMNSLYFFYNLLIIHAITRYVNKYSVKSIFLGVLFASIIAGVSILQNGVSLEIMGESGRETATFNNPNQLGFFSVCLLSIAYFFYVVRQINYPVMLVFFCFSLLLSILSLSKAAIIANGAVILFAIVPKLNIRTFPILLVAAFTVIGYINSIYISGDLDRYLFVQRLSSIAYENDSSLESRGYFAILEGGALNLFFGMGSYEVKRILGHEVHSTFGSVANNYGLVGLLLFSSLIYIWASKIYRHFGIAGSIFIVIPPLLYGITHNGTRFVFFWILIATTLGYVNRRPPHPATKSLA
jgi:hypothetical protein